MTTARGDGRAPIGATRDTQHVVVCSTGALHPGKDNPAGGRMEIRRAYDDATGSLVGGGILAGGLAAVMAPTERRPPPHSPWSELLGCAGDHPDEPIQHLVASRSSDDGIRVSVA